MAKKKLAANVYIDGKFYKAGSTPPKEIAEKIDNPKAWGSDDAAAEPEEEVEPTGAAKYEAQTVADLKVEITARNEGRQDEAKVSADGNKPDLVAALVADDEAQAQS